MVSEWCTRIPPRRPAPANFLEGSTDGQYAYNSVRVPWHLGVDAAVYGDAAGKAEAQKIAAWFRTKTGDNPSKVVSGYKLDGTPVVSYLDPEFVATMGPAAMGNPANQAWLNSNWTYTVAQSQTSAANSYWGSEVPHRRGIRVIRLNVIAAAVAGLGLGAVPMAAASPGPVYKNCTEAHNHGVWDIPESDDAYWSDGDRDGDGVACESYS